jgi:hypothetical protein
MQRTFHVFARDSVSPRLLKATKDLFPWYEEETSGESHWMMVGCTKATDFELEIDDGWHLLGMKGVERRRAKTRLLVLGR